MPCITFLSNRKPFSFILLIRLDRTCTSLEIDQDSVKQSNAGREGPEKWRNDWWDGMSVEWGLFTQVYSATFFSKCLMYSEYSRLSLRCARYSLKYSGYSRYSRVFLEYLSSILLDIFRISFQTLSEYFSKPSFMYLHLQHLLKNNFTLFPAQKQKTYQEASKRILGSEAKRLLSNNENRRCTERVRIAQSDKCQMAFGVNVESVRSVKAKKIDQVQNETMTH